MNMVVRACDPGTWEVETGGLEAQGSPWIHSKSKSAWATLEEEKKKSEGQRSNRGASLTHLFNEHLIICWTGKTLCMNESN